MEKQINYSIPVTIYGNLERYNDTISKARCRIFYKYANRNGTYITDEFADKLLATVSYTPVKGIFENEDFTDHGERRDEGRIYGIVPENSNLSWEKHVDEDGIEREYACVDVLIFTALYQEANQIVGKSLSMEIYDKTAKGNWIVHEGMKYYAFTEGSFLGLQVLGEEVEPCFEGAGFYTLYTYLKTIYEKNKGENKMALNFKLSDSEKFSLLWHGLNPDFNEEGDFTVVYEICDVYDDYVLVHDLENKCHVRVYYTKTENDTIEFGEKVRCYILDVTEEEYTALKNYRAGVETYVGIDDIANENSALKEENSNLKEENSNFVSKIEELESEKDTLTTERDNMSNQFNEAATTINSLNEEIETLNSFKHAVEKKEKEQIISNYENLLNSETIEKYTVAMDTYSATDLDKELAYELKNANPGIFANGGMSYTITDNPLSEIEEILSKTKRNK